MTPALANSRLEPAASSRWWVGMVALTLFASPYFPGASFLGPLVARQSPLRSSRRRMRALWVLASIITALYIVLLVAAIADMWPSWLMFDPEEDA